MYKIETASRRVEREIAGGSTALTTGLPHGIRDRVIEAIQKLAEEPRPRGARKLAGEMRGACGLSPPVRVRIGEYRVLYDVDDEAQKITILRVKHRRDVYRSR